MTLAEVDRAVESHKRLLKQNATFLYTLADLIGYSVGRIHNSNNKMPSIESVFPTLFDAEEKAKQEEERKIDIFTIQLKQFSNSHNKKLKGG